MPASWRAWPAGCIFGLSFFEPMMIPTRGASTSISSNAASTSGIGSGGLSDVSRDARLGARLLNLHGLLLSVVVWFGA